MESSSFTLPSELKKALDYWWIILLVALLGGLGGWVAHKMRPPLYEAQAAFSAAIDYAQTGQMTQFEEDQALNAVGHLIDSHEVLQRTAEAAQSQGMIISIEDLKRMAVVERQVDLWILRLRHPDPNTAARLANLWATEADAILEEAQIHALRVAELSRYMKSVEQCLQQAVIVNPAAVPCQQRSLNDIQELLQTTGQALAEERQASRNLFPGLTVHWVSQASPPTQPIQFKRNDFMLAGTLIGFLLGVIVVQTVIPRRRPKS